MSIIVCATQAEADSVSDPKRIWYDIGRIVVYTGADIPVQPQSILSTLEFRTRFTESEMDAIETLAYSGSGDVIARRILLKLQTRTDIDLDNPAVIDGMAYWVVKGILSQSRSDEILS